jgi:hypothetical protein
MKRSDLTSTLKKAGIVIMLVCVFAASVSAQKMGQKKYELKENAIKSLILGISHENEGVRKSSIYYSGIYMIRETVDALIEQLEREKVPSTRVLIILSLYMIGEQKGLDAIYKTAFIDSDPKVRRMCNAISTEIKKAKDLMAFSSNRM